jgi:hypothetical protein
LRFQDEVFAMSDILMPKATAVWLVDNTGLTLSRSPISPAFTAWRSKALRTAMWPPACAAPTRWPPASWSARSWRRPKRIRDYRMTASKPKYAELQEQKRKGPRYTPLSRRQNRPDAIAWLVRNHPELTDGQISKLIGTTKTTIEAVRERTHWNSAEYQADRPGQPGPVHPGGSGRGRGQVVRPPQADGR